LFLFEAAYVLLLLGNARLPVGGHRTAGDAAIVAKHHHPGAPCTPCGGVSGCTGQGAEVFVM